MGEVTREAFLKYHNFEDDPEMIPQYFIAGRGNYQDLLKDVKEDVRVGVRLTDSIALNCAVGRQQVYMWKRAFLKEIEDGKKDTPLIRLFNVGLKTEAKLYRKVMQMMMDKAEEGDASSIQYLAKHRLDYNSSRKQEVEVSTKDDAPIKFEIVDMKPNEGDE